ncbi:WXG100 family type VII secretion target [Serinicoccus chungangensis]|uniref:WXG100 family type VII secretion target n=1 Tax=Serinicoccus chungangensis TaxID=767452 RepID=UPI00111864D5|nr:WXG100 family type VII secretion target [Serinicoccus chungangensis]
MAVGGELATLRDLHKTLDTSALDIQRVSEDIDKSLNSTVWTGANSEKFKDAWQTFRPTLTPKLVDALNEAKEDIKTQHNNLAAATGESDRI